jgi:low temperature requirement protein LtrA
MSSLGGVPSSARVTTLELFFDLVFVFTITQLTAVLAAGFDPVAVVRVVLMFGVIWWMYAGYAWLTNAVAPSSSARRGFLIAGMCGFLGIALAIPGTFGATGWAFGIGYLVVNSVHTGLFWAAGGPEVVRSVTRLGGLNAISAGLVLAGCLLPGGWRYAGLAAALALQIATPYLHPTGGYDIRAAHFVERHGLVVIIALGESVVAIGVGAGSHRLDAGLLAMAVLGLLLAYLLWWAYFGGDDERAEHALGSITDRARRARVAITAYGYAHFPLLIGIVALAAGVKKAIAHPGEPLHLGPALALGGGVALFLAADALYRRILAIGRIRYRLAGAALALVTVPLAWTAAWVQLVAVFVAVAVVEGVERRVGSPAEAGEPV